MNTETPEQTALKTLIQAVQIATKRGAFELSETKVIAEAVDMFTKPSPKAQNDDLKPTTAKKGTNGAKHKNKA